MGKKRLKQSAKKKKMKKQTQPQKKPKQNRLQRHWKAGKNNSKRSKAELNQPKYAKKGETETILSLERFCRMRQRFGHV